MILKPSIVLALALCFLNAGCGGAGTSPPTISDLPPFAGNVNIKPVSAAFPADSGFIGGSVHTDANGNVTGILHASIAHEPFGSCFALATDISVTGTIDQQGRLTVTSSTVNNLVLTISAAVSSDGQTVSSGTYSIGGGGVCIDRGTITGFVMQPFSGSYNGSFTVGTGTVSMAGALMQSATADSDGFFRFGSAMFEMVDSAGCGLGGGAAAIDMTKSFAVGNQLELTLNVVGPSSTIVATVQFSGTAANSTAKSVTGQFAVSGGACTNQTFQGTLSQP